MPVAIYLQNQIDLRHCPELNEAHQALRNALFAVGSSLDSELLALLDKYCARRLEQKALGYDDAEFYRRALIQDEATRIGSKLSETMGLLGMVADFANDDERASFGRWLATINDFRIALNAFLLSAHPSLGPINATELMTQYKGTGIKIAVYDVFDLGLLESQKQHYPNARLHDVVNFGHPVQLDHGNTVIDVILAIAPEAEIYPISSDTTSAADALHFLNQTSDTSIVNMSRAFTQNKTGRLDEPFRVEMEKLVHNKIVVKSLGNSGTDLLGNVSSARLRLGLGPTGALTAYDVGLIKELLGELSGDNLILAQNWSLDGTSVALSATVFGNAYAAQQRTVGAPADGVFSFASGNFESGSSFAAPQISATAALLLQMQLAKWGTPNLRAISTSLQTNGKLLNADEALQRLSNHR